MTTHLTRCFREAAHFELLATRLRSYDMLAIAEHVLEKLRDEGVRPQHVEGLSGGRWVLLDYVDFVVHVFHPAAREFYQLERLWGDAPIRELEPEKQS